MPLTRRSDSLRRCLPLAFLSACFAPAGSAWAQTPVPSGGEFQVNTYTTSRQRYASVSGVGTAGDFVVAWRDDTQDGSGAGIFGQRFASDGIPQGSEFQVNSYTTGSQTLVSVSGVGTAGDFVMAWLEGAGTTGRVSASSASALPQTARPRVASSKSTPTRRAARPLCRCREWGRPATSSWRGTAPMTGAAAPVSSASALPQTAHARAANFRSPLTRRTTRPTPRCREWGRPATSSCVAELQSGRQQRRRVRPALCLRRHAPGQRFPGQLPTRRAARAAPRSRVWVRPGDFVVAWRDQGAQDGDSSGIFGQRFTSDGTPQGSEFQVNTYTTSNQGRTSVAGVGTTGDFVVTWFSSGQDGSGYGVFGQRFASDGTPQGSEFQVNSHTASTQTAPSVAELGTAGDFVVAWHSAFQDGYQDGVFGQRFARPATVTVTAPVATKQNFGVGSEQRIRAEHDLGSAATFDVAISRDYGSSFSDIGTGVASASNGTAINLDWTVTDGGQSTPQPGSQVRVTSVTPVAGASDTTVIFTIDSDSINVRRPRNNVATGVAFKIVWLHNIGYRRPFQIELSRDDGNNFTETIASSTLSQWAWRGQFFWTPSGGCSTTCVVRVTSLDPVATTGDSVTFNIV